MSILIQNGQIVLADKIVKSDILIEGNRIKKIGLLSGVKADKVIDAAGKTVMAGFVDMHCHLREPGYEYKEDILSGAKSAAAGGFTSICCMPNTNPPLDTPAFTKEVCSRAAAVSPVKIYPVGAITKGLKSVQLTDMGKLKEAGAIALSDDGRPVESALMMRNALAEAAKHDLLVISHTEDVLLSADGVVNDGGNAAKAGLKGIPRDAEEVMAARDIILAENLGTRVHIAHVSTAGSVQLVREAKARGVKVTAEVCPHHFSATDKEVLTRDTSAKINPPLREDSDVAAIIEGLKDGTIDCIATDHAPHSADEKQQDITKAPFGTIGFESAFAVSYTYLVESGALDLIALSWLLSRNPARILGLGSGVIAEGEVADLAIVDLNESYIIDAGTFKSKARNCLFDGWRVKGRVLGTIADGEIIEMN